MTSWDERFAAGEYPRLPDVAEMLRRHVREASAGRALDVATGTGRNAVFLARAGFDVDAIDKSREGLRIARENAEERGVAERIEFVQADVPTYAFPDSRYDLVTISFYRAVDRFPDVKEALAPGGYFFVEHHLRSSDPTPWGPGGDRYRFASNELLHACLDLTVLYYEESTEERPGGDQRAVARILARNSSGPRQTYPPTWLE